MYREIEFKKYCFLQKKDCNNMLLDVFARNKNANAH